MAQLNDWIEITGTVESVIFRNEENGYAVVRFLRDDEDEITLIGTLPEIAPGEELAAAGVWVTHATYGDQFSVLSYERRLPATEKGIFDYLASRTVRGVGERTARRIVDRFGTDTFRVMAEEPERLAGIRGISPEKAREIGKSFADKAAFRMLTELLLTNGVPPHIAAGVYSVYGGHSVEMVRGNPYLLCDERWDVDFSVADRMAGVLGFAEDAERRLCEGILYELRFNSENGHSFLPYRKLISASADLMGVSEKLLEPAVNRLCEESQVVREEICGEDAVYLLRLHLDEVSLAGSLTARIDSANTPPVLEESALLRLFLTGGIKYSDKQMEAVRLAAEKRVLVITGGPGTGKTTTVHGILNMFSACGIHSVLAAPTGRAAKRMSELSGEEARTLHRLLEAAYSPKDGMVKFHKDEKDPIDADAVVVDEASMVDIRLAAALMRALRPETRIIFVGDPDQLPPVGPGSFLADLLRCGNIPSVRLTEIFRQARESDIVMNAHRINRGQPPNLSDGGKDFYFIKRAQPNEVATAIVQLVGERIPAKFGISPDRIQVLSPWKKREIGTVALNRILADALNPADPAKKELRAGATLFREGDRVMQIKNNYDLLWEKTGGAVCGTGVFNGDIGQIICIEPTLEQVVVLFDDRIIHYPFSGMAELDLAYAVTVHKAQGSEFDAVILTAVPGPSALLTRSILYTAVTRAKKLMVIVGEESVLRQMVKSTSKDARYSALSRRLSAG